MKHRVPAIKMHRFLSRAMHSNQKKLIKLLQIKCKPGYVHLRVVWVWSVEEPLIHRYEVSQSDLEDKRSLQSLYLKSVSTGGTYLNNADRSETKTYIC